MAARSFQNPRALGARAHAICRPGPKLTTDDGQPSVQLSKNNTGGTEPPPITPQLQYSASVSASSNVCAIYCIHNTRLKSNLPPFANWRFFYHSVLLSRRMLSGQCRKKLVRRILVTGLNPDSHIPLQKNFSPRYHGHMRLGCSKRSCIWMLAISALITIHVAWTCMLVSPYRELPSWPLGENSELATGPNGAMNWWLTNRGFGVRTIRAMGSHDRSLFSNRGSDRTPVFFRSGWPLPAMQSIVAAVPPPGGDPLDYDHDLRKWNLPFTEIIRRGPQTAWMPAWWHVEDRRRLPLLPLLPGFIIDTLLYFLVLLGIAAIWRRFRCPLPPATS